MKIVLQEVVKRFGAVAAVDHVSLEIASGELFFLLGPSGCGKTTCLRMIAGFIPPDQGAVIFGDRDVTSLPPNRRNTGMVFQNYALWPHMTVLRNVAYGLEVRHVERRERDNRVMEALEVVRMCEKADRFPNQLSGGEQQRVALARALVIRPDVLLLDEPLSNLDAKLRMEMRQEIRRIHDELKLTAVYVTHDQKEALSIADRLAVMRQGKVEQVATPRAMYSNPANAFVATFLGEANLIPGIVRRIGESIEVDTDFGVLSVAKTGQSVTQGDKVLCCVRPEAVEMARINESAGAEAIPWRGVIGSITYLGEAEQYVIRVSRGQASIDLRSVRATGAGMALREPGDQVALRIPPDSISLLPDRQ